MIISTEAAPAAACAKKSIRTWSRPMQRSMERNVAFSEVTSRLGLKFGMRVEKDMGEFRLLG
jgi:hypothetical protein